MYQKAELEVAPRIKNVRGLPLDKPGGVDNWTVSLRSGPDCAAQRVAHGLRGCGCGSQRPEAEGGPSPWVSLSPCPIALPRPPDPRPSVGRVCSHASQACPCMLA